MLSQNDAANSSISIQETETSISNILDQFTEQSGLEFSFNSKLLNLDKKVSLYIDDLPLNEALQVFCQQERIQFSIVDEQIVLFKKNKKVKNKNLILSGYIMDDVTGEMLINATLYDEVDGRGTISNEFGYYVLELSKGKHSLSVSYLGYETKTLNIEQTKDQKKDFRLRTSTFDLPQVTVGLKAKQIQLKSQLDQMSLTPQEFTSFPEFGGEVGLAKSLQSLPGIKIHSDISSFFYARGGERDQNLIIIDDAPIYNPSHLLGFYSVVIPEFTKDIKVYKSDIPAGLGDRLSSIVSIRTKDGNLNRTKATLSLNPLVSRFSFETPLKEDKSSIFFSFRRSSFNWLLRNANGDIDLGFQDFHLKWNYKINDRNRIYATIIQSSDNYENTVGPAQSIRWDNVSTALRWNHLINNRMFVNTTIYSSNYSHLLNISPNLWRSELANLSLKSDFTHYVAPYFEAKFGAGLEMYLSTPGKATLDSTFVLFPTINSNSSSKSVLYYQGKLDINPKLEFNVGLRYTNFANHGPREYYTYGEDYEVQDTIWAPGGIYNNYPNLDPRLSLQYQVDSTSQLKLSYGTYRQYFQLILNSISPFSALEVWLPSSTTIKPQSSSQWSLDYIKAFRKKDLEFGASAYLKESSNQIDYKPHATTFLNPLLEGELRFGTARSYGLECMLKKKSGRLNGWISYSYARVFRTTEGLNNNQEYPAFQDRPHDLSIVLNYELTPQVLFSAYWTSFSGSSFTSPVGFYTFNGENVPIYGDKNNDRLPAYHRLDLSLKCRLNKNENAKINHSLNFSLYNALAHKNTYDIKFNKLDQDRINPPVPSNILAKNNLRSTQADLIRFFPSISYMLKI